MLLHRRREIRPALHRRVVAHDQHLAARDAADAGDQAGAGRFVVVEAVGGELAEFEEGRAGIEQALDTVAGQQFAARDVAGPGGLRATKRRRRHTSAEVVGEAAVVLGVGLEGVRAWVEGGGQAGHVAIASEPAGALRFCETLPAWNPGRD